MWSIATSLGTKHIGCRPFVDKMCSRMCLFSFPVVVRRGSRIVSTIKALSYNNASWDWKSSVNLEALVTLLANSIAHT